MDKIDTLSPSFIGGMLGYAVSESATGFLIGAAVVWFALMLLIVVAALSARESGTRRSFDRASVHHEFAE